MGTSTTCTKASAWAASTAYSIGDRVTNDTPTRLYTCSSAGTSAGSGGPTGTGTGISDNTCEWDYVDDVDYTSLSSWESNEQIAAVSGSGTTQVTCYKSGNADTAALVIDGWGATSAAASVSDHIYILVDYDEMHDGTDQTGYYMETTGGSTDTVSILDDDVNVRIQGLAGKSARHFIHVSEADGDHQFQGCLAYDCGDCGFLMRTGGSAPLWNCIAINCALDGSTGNGGYRGNTTTYPPLMACTILNSEEHGARRVGNPSRNTICMGSIGGNDFNTIEATPNYLASEDATATGAQSLTSVAYLENGDTISSNYIGFESTTLGSENPTLWDGGDATYDNLALEGGTDLSSSTETNWTSPNDPRGVDAFGTTRTTNPDLGAIQISVAPLTVAVPAGDLALSGKNVTIQRAVAPAAGSITLAGKAPSLVFATPVGAGSISFTGYAPTVTVGSPPINIDVPAGSLGFTGLAPTLIRAVQVGLGTLELTPQTPTIKRANPVSIGGLSLQGYAPTISIVTPGGPDAVDVFEMLNDKTRYVVRLMNQSGGDGESKVTKVDRSALFDVNGAEPAALDIMQVWWDCRGMQALLEWDRSGTDDEIFIVAGTGHKDFRLDGMLRDPDPDDGTGDVLATTIGHTENDTYDILIEFSLRRR